MFRTLPPKMKRLPVSWAMTRTSSDRGPRPRARTPHDSTGGLRGWNSTPFSNCDKPTWYRRPSSPLAEKRPGRRTAAVPPATAAVAAGAPPRGGSPCSGRSWSWRQATVVGSVGAPGPGKRCAWLGDRACGLAHGGAGERKCFSPARKREDVRIMFESLSTDATFRAHSVHADAAVGAQAGETLRVHSSASQIGMRRDCWARRCLQGPRLVDGRSLGRGQSVSQGSLASWTTRGRSRRGEPSLRAIRAPSTATIEIRPHERGSRLSQHHRQPCTAVLLQNDERRPSRSSLLSSPDCRLRVRRPFERSGPLGLLECCKSRFMFDPFTVHLDTVRWSAGSEARVGLERLLRAGHVEAVDRLEA